MSKKCSRNLTANALFLMRNISQFPKRGPVFPSFTFHLVTPCFIFPAEKANESSSVDFPPSNLYKSCNPWLRITNPLEIWSCFILPFGSTNIYHGLWFQFIRGLKWTNWLLIPSPVLFIIPVDGQFGYLEYEWFHEHCWETKRSPHLLSFLMLCMVKKNVLWSPFRAGLETFSGC